MPGGTSGDFDLPGALLVTSSLVAVVYAIVGAAYNPPAVTALLLLVASDADGRLRGGREADQGASRAPWHLRLLA